MLVSELDGDGSTLVLDKESVAAVGKLRKAWFKWSYSATNQQRIPLGAKNDTATGDLYNDQLSLYYFNCAERTSAMVQSLYRIDGNVVGSFAKPAQAALYSEVAPETVGESMLKAACKFPLKTSS